MLRHRLLMPVLGGIALLAFLGLNRGALAAEKDKPKDGGTVSGIRTDNGSKEVEVLADGEDTPVKYVVGADFEKKVLNGIFSVCRVQLVYKLNGDARQLVSIKKERTQISGTVTGVVTFANDFWVGVKSQNGPVDGYAAHYPPPPAMVEKLKALHRGDTVTIKFTTDGERHRIETLQKIQ